MMQPLAEFLQVEMSKDLLANAATFQLLGLTELTPVLNEGQQSGGTPGEDKELPVSASPVLAAQLRRCTREHGRDSLVAKTLLEYALHRLEHKVDALLLHERMDDSVSTAVTLVHQHKPAAPPILGRTFQQCVSSNTDKMKSRKSGGMNNLVWPDGSMLWFGKEARQTLPSEVLQSIRDENWMDEALHLRATELFDQRFKALSDAGVLRRVRKSILKDM